MRLRTQLELRERSGALDPATLIQDHSAMREAVVMLGPFLDLDA